MSRLLREDDPAQPALHRPVVHRAVDLGGLAAAGRGRAHRPQRLRRTCTARSSSTTSTRRRPESARRLRPRHDARPACSRRGTWRSSSTWPGVTSRSRTSAAARGTCWPSLLEKHPALHGTLLDLPGVVANADAAAARRAARSPTGSASCRATAARPSRCRPTSTSSRTSWSGTTRAPAALAAQRRRGGAARAPGSW